MRTVRNDMIGKTFGMLTVIGLLPKYKAECRCGCGSFTIKRYHHILSGAVTSCGCSTSALLRKSSTKHGEGGRRNRSSEYRSWAGMWSRCNNPNTTGFANYGGRGIRVCGRWQSYSAFLSDRGRKPSSVHSIERINNEGGYSPENCRWATSKEQARNQRTSRFIAAFGTTKTLVEWQEETGVDKRKIWKRLNSGWAAEKALV